MKQNNKLLVAHYASTLAEQPGIDRSGNKNHATVLGSGKLPTLLELDGRPAIQFYGGMHGSGFIQLPANLLANVDDETGLTVVSWIYLREGQSVWERIFDFGEGEQGPYLFLTRNLRGVCFNGADIAVDYNKQLPIGTWVHIAYTISGTKGGTESKAGPKLYLNGRLVVDGSISQTSSGAYLAYRQWLATLSGQGYAQNYIGRSQFAADADFNGAISDFRIYEAALQEEDIISIMCETLSDEQIISIASRNELSLPTSIVTESIALPQSLLGGLVAIEWTSSNPEVLTAQGEVNDKLNEPQAVELTATLRRGNASYMIAHSLTVLPKETIPYEIELIKHGKSAEISPHLYGLFYEDINNAADGGIYAELVRNRSFEAFTYDSYSHICGEHGHSTGRRHQPLEGWYGQLERLEVCNEGGLNEHFALADTDTNAYYVKVLAGTTIVNKGFNDSNHQCAMSFTKGEGYLFTIWAKAEPSSARDDNDGQIQVQLQDSSGEAISDTIVIPLRPDGKWHKYGVSESLCLVANKTTLGQLSLHFTGEAAIDMVSLFPEQVWGASEEDGSPTAHRNFKGNSNYRLRRDMVLALQKMKPRFLRFPGGCISEGSHIWENVYDWKHSVGPVELRKENFNVWGYMMTLGLGYMEYFQLAEDLNATPLPVMACGVLCQARSDYANPAGGSLRDYYIKNFTDLIDFALSEDVKGNEWAKLRSSMGHPEPFDLRYLGVGNENWGSEFYANFEIFKNAIDEYMAEHYPQHKLTIISTVGAQADDDAYQQGWKFLSGNYKGSETIAFTDGKNRITEHITWYSKQPHYMDTIVDEHYYRSNDYLLANVDRYNYYFRAYDEQGNLDEALSSKVFVGEYASNDKNTLAGAIAEAAMMTGFENNADVVRLAAYAPLFNKVLSDGQYRWTPDCIWFDDSDIWFTPNYYVQTMFAQNIGTRTVASCFKTFRNGKQIILKPEGGISLSTVKGHIVLKKLTIRDQINGQVVFEQDFTQQLDEKWQWLNDTNPQLWQAGVGVVLQGDGNKRTGLFIEESWSDIIVDVIAYHLSDDDGLYIGVGLQGGNSSKVNVIEYVAGERGKATGIKVFKQGVEAYTLGDYASSSMAGNMRAAYDEKIEADSVYCYRIVYGGGTSDVLHCSHHKQGEDSARFSASYKLEAYNDEIYYSASVDEQYLYMKLVNADPINKSVRIKLGAYLVDKLAIKEVLTGEAALLNMPNVNKKNAELITPRQETVKLEGNELILELPAHSVQAVRWSLKQ